jgi:hypothetical protein
VDLCQFDGALEAVNGFPAGFDLLSDAEVAQLRLGCDPIQRLKRGGRVAHFLSLVGWHRLLPPRSPLLLGLGHDLHDRSEADFLASLGPLVDDLPGLGRAS